MASFLVASVFNATTLAAEPVVIRFAHSAAVDSPKGQMALHFQKLIKESLGDKSVVVEVYPEGMLFDDKQILPAVIKNRVQLVVTPISNMQSFSPRLKLFDLPFLFVSEEAASNFLEGEYGDRILRLIGRSEVIGLGFLDGGMKQLSSSNKVTIPKEAKNLKFLTSNSDVTSKFYRNIGARPIVANLNKTATLLKNKLAEGQEGTWSNIRTRGIHNYQAYILESNHVYLADVILASAESWKSIPENIQSIIEIQLKKSIAYGNNFSRNQAVDERELIVNSGLSEIITMSVEQRQQCISVTKGVWKEFEDEVGAELIRAAASSR